MRMRRLAGTLVALVAGVLVLVGAIAASGLVRHSSNRPSIAGTTSGVVAATTTTTTTGTPVDNAAAAAGISIVAGPDISDTDIGKSAAAVALAYEPEGERVMAVYSATACRLGGVAAHSVDACIAVELDPSSVTMIPFGKYRGDGEPPVESRAAKDAFVLVTPDASAVLMAAAFG
jgi:hypothetical protein